MPLYYSFHATTFSLPLREFSPYRNFYRPLSHSHRGISPTMPEFFRPFFPSTLYKPGKLPSLLTEGIPAYLMERNAVDVSKTILLAA
jgi:hypothetical protein